MSLGKILAWCAIGFVGFEILNTFKQKVTETSQSLVITPSGLTTDFSNPLNPRLTISAIFVNPSTMSITVESFFATITINDGTILGTVNLNNPTTVPAGNQATITLPISLNGLNIVTDLISGNIDYSVININGYYLVNNIKIPYTNIFKLPLY